VLVWHAKLKTNNETPKTCCKHAEDQGPRSTPPCFRQQCAAVCREWHRGKNTCSLAVCVWPCPAMCHQIANMCMKSLLAELSDPSREQPSSNSALASSLRGTNNSSSGLQDMAWRSLVPRKAIGTDRKLRSSGLYTVHAVHSIPAVPNKIRRMGVVSGMLRA